MPLREAAIAVRFQGGIETKQDEKGVLPTKLLALENGVFTKGISIRKRNGYADLGKALLGSGSTLPTARALGKRDTDLFALTEDALYSYMADESVWDASGDMQSVKLTHEAVAKSTHEQTLADYAANGGIAVYAWEDSAGGVYFAVLDDDTNHVIVRPTELDANGSCPRVHAIGDVVHVYYADDTNGYIWSLVVNPADPTIVATPSPAVMIEDLNTTTPAYDVDDDGTKGVITWYSKTATTICTGYIHHSGELGRPANGLDSWVSCTGTVSENCLAVSIDKTDTVSNYVLVTWWHATGATYLDPAYVKGIIYKSDLTVRAAIFTIDTTISDPVAKNHTNGWQVDGAPWSRQAWVFTEYNDASAQKRFVEYQTVSDVGSCGSVVTQKGVGLGSKVFADSGCGDSAYVHLVHETTLYTTYLLMRSDGVIMGRCLSGVAGGVTASVHLPTVKTSGRVASWAGVYRVGLGGSDGDVYTEKGIRKITLDFDSSQSHQSAQLGRTAYVAGGGMLWAYDGDQVVEQGFHVVADDIATPALSSASGGLVNGTYYYRVTYEWTNARGEIVMGPTSAGTELEITGGEDTATLTIPMLRFTGKTDPMGEVRIGVWRTEDGDSVYYRVSSLDPTATGANGYLVNDPTADTDTFVDKYSDATLITKEPLYTNGGILSNDPTPCGEIVAVGKNRLWTNDPSDPLLVRYSQELRDGYAVEMAPALSVAVDPFGGDITGLGILDDKVVVFKEAAIFWFAGPGPLANPDVGGGFSQPQQVPTAVGCSGHRSIAACPAGLVFQSDQGIYLLDRGLNVSYIGAPVESYNDQTVVSAEATEDAHQVRFLTDSGSTLFWDYLFDQWSTATNHEGIDAIVVNGLYYYLRNDGYVWEEAADTYDDDGSQIKLILETSWVKLTDALQGFQRIWHVEIIGEYKSAHTLRFRYQTDYEPGWSAPIDLDPSEFYDEAQYGEGNYGDGVYGGEAVHRYQFKVHVGAKCEAIRFRFEDIEASGVADASFELSEILITGGVKRRDYHLADARSY